MAVALVHRRSCLQSDSPILQTQFALEAIKHHRTMHPRAVEVYKIQWPVRSISWPRSAFSMSYRRTQDTLRICIELAAICRHDEKLAKIINIQSKENKP